MKTAHIILLLVGVAVVGVAVWLLVLRGPVAENGGAGEPTDTVFTGSLTQLAQRGGTTECTFSGETNGIASSGTVYVSGKNVRGDFTTTVPEFGTVESHMIADGTMVYTWSSMMNTGFSMAQTQAEAAGNVDVQGQSVNVNQAYSYSCVSWMPDSSKFELPTDITFTAV